MCACVRRCLAESVAGNNIGKRAAVATLARLTAATSQHCTLFSLQKYTSFSLHLPQRPKLSFVVIIDIFYDVI